MDFSQRIGVIPAIKQLQIDAMDIELRNGIWNGFKLSILDNIDKTNYSDGCEFKLFCSVMWHQFYKLPIDTIPHRDYDTEQQIRARFFKSQWYGVYDFLEFVVNMDVESIKENSKGFKEFCNSVFEREFSGYRFINDQISPITNENEIEEIEKAIEQSGSFTALIGVNIHLKSALDKLSDKKIPDYRNSIKESISAIESVSKVISGNKKDSLSGALDKIKGKIKIHPALERGFKQLYGYTSDSDGIRHALMEEDNCDFEDAKYMLVSSSAFINYLIVKAQKVGVEGLSDN
jgi:hypothetical protein